MMAAGLIIELYSSDYSSMIEWNWIQPRSQRIFLLKLEGEKETLEHFKHMIIYPESDTSVCSHG